MQYKNSPNEIPEGSILAIDGSKGIYAPQQFMARYGHLMTHNAEKDEGYALPADNVKEGPNGYTHGEFYWESWQEITDNATVIILQTTYRIYQDQDIWLIPEV